MSERKVLSKYYPPDFDPRSIERPRHKKKREGPALQTVRLMSPMNMRCMRCGEYIARGRKFNARKETPDESYLGNQIFRFYIRCTRCSGEIIFRSDPKNHDYVIVSGAKRNVEPWHTAIEETVEERLDRLEAEEAAAAAAEAGGPAYTNGDNNRMEELEAKTLEARREMDVADALDEIRTRNARIARADHREHLEAMVLARPTDEEARLRQEELEDAEAARQAFAAAAAAAAGESENDDEVDVVPANKSEMGLMLPPPLPKKASGSSSSGKKAVVETQPRELREPQMEPELSDPAPGPAPAPTQAEPAPAALDPIAAMPAPSFQRQVKKKKDRAALLGIKKKPALV